MAYSGGDQPDVAGVLADRIAATLVQHEPGWRLPRPSAIARRYDVRPAQVEQAVRELAARHLIRQLPDGQLYRASPAEFLVPVHGVPRLGAHVDPMGGKVSCRSRKISWRRVPEDVSWALGTAIGEPVCAVKCQWSVNGDPAAICTTYLTSASADEIGEASRASEIGEASRASEIGEASRASGASGASDPGDPGELGELGGLGDAAQRLLLGAVLGGTPTTGQRSSLGLPAALHLEMQPPPPSIARGLRLGAGQPATLVTMRFDEQSTGRPMALLVAALRADLFRVVVESSAGDLPAAPLEFTEGADDDSGWSSGRHRPGDGTDAVSGHPDPTLGHAKAAKQA